MTQQILTAAEDSDSKLHVKKGVSEVVAAKNLGLFSSFKQPTQLTGGRKFRSTEGVAEPRIVFCQYWYIIKQPRTLCIRSDRKDNGIRSGVARRYTEWLVSLGSALVLSGNAHIYE